MSDPCTVSPNKNKMNSRWKPEGKKIPYIEEMNAQKTSSLRHLLGEKPIYHCKKLELTSSKCQHSNKFSGMAQCSQFG